MLKLAVCDYPEHVSDEIFASFPARQHQLGLSYVRIGEFAWSKLEPQPGQFDFAWLDAAIAQLGAAGLGVVLCTPTATPPAWLVRQYPDILPVDKQGRVRDFGSRRHYDYSSQRYWQESRRIVEVLAERYGQNPHVVGWQTDNEHGCHDTTRSYSENAKLGFQLWLKNKYTTLEALNSAWGTVFWSQDYHDWSEIGLHHLTVTEPNPSHVLDFYRYSSDQVVAYDRMQTEILRAHSPGKFVTHNYMIFFGDFDHYQAAEHLDFVSWDNYPTGMLEFFAPDGVGEELKTAFARTGHPDLVAFNHDLYRGLKDKGFWVMEQQCGQVNWAPFNPLPTEGAVKLWSLQAFAHGAEVVSYFRWQAATMAQELMHSGLLRFDGTPDRGLAEVQALAPKLPLLSAAPIVNTVAVLHDYESLWALDVQPHAKSATYWAQLMSYYMPLRMMGIDVDVRHPLADLSGYKVVVAPALHLMSEAMAAHLSAYVEGGGQLVVGPRTGFRQPNGQVWASRSPGPLAATAGVRVANFDALRPGLSSRVEAFDQSYQAHTWNESLELIAADATVLASYSNGPLCDLPAIVRRSHGQGSITTVGLWQEQLLAKVLARTLFSVGIAAYDLEEGLRLSRRGGLVYAQNWSRGGLIAPVPTDGEFVLGGPLLGAADVAVWKE
jgi:beta-galactosidase